MARYFLDSSALFKRYHVEAGSEAVDLLFAGAANRLLISELALVEIRSSLARRVRDGIYSPADFQSLVRRVVADVVGGRVSVAAVGTRRLEQTAALFSDIGLKHNLRTLDAIHLATALAIHSRTRLTAFVAADRKLLAVAESACGLNVIAVG